MKETSAMIVVILVAALFWFHDLLALYRIIIQKKQAKLLPLNLGISILGFSFIFLMHEKSGVQKITIYQVPVFL